MSKRDKLIASIKEGNSIIIHDKATGQFKQFTLANIEDLPSEADLAIGDKEAEAKALADVEAKLKELEASKKKLEEAKTKGKAKVAVPEPAAVVDEEVAEEAKKGK